MPDQPATTSGTATATNTVPAEMYRNIAPPNLPPPLDWAQLPETGVLFNFLMKFSTGGYGTPEDFKRKMREIRRGLSGAYRREGHDAHLIEGMVQKQLDCVENMMHEMSGIMRRYGIRERRLTGFGDPPESDVDEGEVLLADDDSLLKVMVDAMESLESVFDMAGTKPWQHFKRMTKPDFMSVAQRVLMCLKRTHAGRGPQETVDGYTFEQRFNDIVDLMTRCKGSVVRMHRPSTLEEVISHPRKMKQRYVDNQVNNMRKKGEKGDYNRLRVLVQASDELRAQAAQMSGTVELGEEDEDDDGDTPARVTGKRRRAVPKPAASRRKQNTAAAQTATAPQTGVDNTSAQASDPQYGAYGQYNQTGATHNNTAQQQLHEYSLSPGTNLAGYGSFDPQLFTPLSEGLDQVQASEGLHQVQASEGFQQVQPSQDHQVQPEQPQPQLSLADQAASMDNDQLHAAIFAEGLTAEEFALFDGLLNFNVLPPAQQLSTSESTVDPPGGNGVQYIHNIDTGYIDPALLGADDSGVADIGSMWDGATYQ